MKLPISGLSAILVRIAIAGMIAAPYWYWSGGLLELEATQFIQQCLDNRGVLQKCSIHERTISARTSPANSAPFRLSRRQGVCRDAVC
jgi:hypothetical protein